MRGYEGRIPAAFHKDYSWKCGRNAKLEPGELAGGIDRDAPNASLGHRFYRFHKFSQAIGLVDEGKILDAPVPLA